MVRILASLVMLIAGLTLVFLTLYCNTKKTIRINTQDIRLPKKNQYFQKILDLITGFSFIFLGMTSFLNPFTGVIIGILSASIIFLNKIIEFIINKRYKKIN